MRGFLSPALKPVSSELQSFFRTLSRGRRVKLAKAAQTTLLKADQWARGDAVGQTVAEALSAQAKTQKAKQK